MNAHDLPAESEKQPGPVLVERLDLVDEQLVFAEKLLFELIRRLEPVLATDFGQRVLPEVAPTHGEPTSPLAARLADLSYRARGLVRHMQTVLEAVDL